MLGDPSSHRAHRLELLADAGCDRLGRARRGSRSCGGCRRLRGGLGRSLRRGGGRRAARPEPPERAGRRLGRRSAGGPDSMKSRMSFLVTRPPRPLPGTCCTSTPCSEAIRATTGETKLGAPLPSPEAPAALALAAGAAPAVPPAAPPESACRLGLGGSGRLVCGLLRRRLGRSLLRGRSGCAGADHRELGADRRPSRPPGRGSRWRMPVPGLGTSVSTLSVEISSSGSSA